MSADDQKEQLGIIFLFGCVAVFIICLGLNISRTDLEPTAEERYERKYDERQQEKLEYIKKFTEEVEYREWKQQNHPNSL